MRPLRNGFSLIEVLVMCSVGSLLFMLAIQLLHTSLDISRSANKELDASRTLSRLERDLRRDLALSVELLASEADEIQFRFPSQNNSRWKLINDHQLVRTQHRVNSPTQIEHYQLTPKQQLSFQPENDSSIVLLVQTQSQVTVPTKLKLERVIRLGVAEMRRNTP